MTKIIEIGSRINDIIQDALRSQTDPVHNRAITVPLIPEISIEDFNRRMSRCLGRQCGKTMSNLKKGGVGYIDIEGDALRTTDV